MRTASFSHSDRSKTFKETHLKPLTSQFFSQLIKLETDFATKQYTASTLDDLTQLYAQAVEYYDSVKDSIASYFMYKIQDTLTTKKSMKILIQQSAKTSVYVQGREGSDPADTASTTSPPDSAGFNNSSSPKGRRTFSLALNAPPIVETLDNESSDDNADEEEEEDEVGEMTRKGKHRRTPNTNQFRGPRKSITSLKNKKQKMFTLQLKLQNQKVQEKQNLTVVLTTFNNTCAEIDKVVQQDIDVQKNKIHTKMARRKKESVINHTHNSSGFLQARDMTMESVLRGLDEEDNIQNPSNNSNDGGSDGNQEERKKSQNDGLTVEQL